MTERKAGLTLLEKIDTVRWDVVNAKYKKAGLKALDREARQAAEDPAGYTDMKISGLDLLSFNEHTDPFGYFSSIGHQADEMMDVLQNMPLEERIFFRWYRAGNQNMMYRFSREEVLGMIKGKLEKLQK